MIFKSYIGKRVMGKNKEIVFISESYETEDEAEIAALSGAMDVTVGDDEAAKAAELEEKAKAEAEALEAEAKSKADAEQAEADAKAKAELDAAEAAKKLADQEAKPKK